MLAALPLLLATAQDVPSVDYPPYRLPQVDVTGQRPPWLAKLQYLLPEVDGALITVTTKATVTHMDQIPTVAQDNLTQLFVRTPGIIVSQEQDPLRVNLTYRGLGNPQESEYVLVLQDGIPAELDWIGFPTLYYQPPLQGVREVQVIRGGNSLLYGPEPAPVINFVSKGAVPGAPFGASTEQMIGSHGGWQTYNVVKGSDGDFAWRVAGWINRSDGPRVNSGYNVKGVDANLLWTPSATSQWGLDLHLYDAASNDAGRLTWTQWAADPNLTTTPTNREWANRNVAVLTHEQQFGDHWRFYGKAWVGTSDLTQRVANPSVPPQPLPAVTNIQNARFRYVGTDLRLRHDFGPGDTLTFGTELYHSDAPLLGANYTDLLAPRDATVGVPTLVQARHSDYASVFASSLFRFGPGHHWHIVPSLRLDHEMVSVFETVRPPNLSRPLLDTAVSRTVPLFGLGIGNDFYDHGHLNETYFNVSTGWRPVRFFDIGSPHANIIPGTAPAVQKVLSYELGIHGTPADGLFYDVSLFWMNFHNRIETINLSPIVSIEQNSGDTHNEGFEGELAYDFLHGSSNGEHLEAFANLQLLHARFVASAIPNQIGKPPAYSPRHLAKAGITWRREGHYKLAFTGVFSGSQYWQDSAQDQPGVGGTVLLPALVPAYSVWDVAANWNFSPHVELLGGVSNVFNRRYYSRVWTYGIEPALGRTWYAGFKLSL